MFCGSPCHHQVIFEFPEVSFHVSLPDSCRCQQWEISGYGLVILICSKCFVPCETDRCTMLDRNLFPSFPQRNQLIIYCQETFANLAHFSKLLGRQSLHCKSSKKLCLNGITSSFLFPFFPTAKFLFISSPECFNHFFYFLDTCQSMGPQY